MEADRDVEMSIDGEGNTVINGVSEEVASGEGAGRF